LTTDRGPAGAVTAVDAPRLLEYATPAEGRVRWELRDGTGNGARLVLTHTGGDRDAALAAWHDHVERLARQVASSAS